VLLALFAGLATANSRLSTTTTIVCPATVTYTGLPQTPCTASVTGTGLSQTLVVRYFRDNTDAGVVVAKARFAGNQTYRPSQAFQRFVITKATSTTTVTCKPTTYTGSPLTPCWAKITGAGWLRLFRTPTYKKNINAGVLTASASYKYRGDRNHTGSMATTKFTIAKATSTTTVTCTKPTYTGSPLKPCSVTVTGAGGLNLTRTPTYKNNTHAGYLTASASYTYKGDRNHTGSTATTRFTILKATSTTTVTCPLTSVMYTGLPLKPCTAMVTGAKLNLPKTPNYKNNIVVGTATASYTYHGDSNHWGSTGSATFAIGQAPSVTTIICTTPTYTGSPLTPCTATVTGAHLNLNKTASLVYATNTNAGVMTASASYTYPGDLNHTGSTQTAMFTINQATSTTTVICPATIPHTGSPLTPCTATVTGANLNLNVTASLIYANNTNVGSNTASASYTYAGDLNHIGSTDTTFFSIT